MEIGLSIGVTFILVLVNGFFSMSEMALVNAKMVILQHEADAGDKRAARAVALAKDSGQLLATIQVAITLVGFFAAAAASTTLSEPLSAWMSGFGVGWIATISPALAPIVITLLVSYVSIVVGELVPKRMALADAEGVSKMVAGTLTSFAKFSSPLVTLTSSSANALSKLFGIKNADERQSLSEEEIKYMVTGNEELLDDEKRMIHDILTLGDMSVHEIMRPRVDMVLVEDSCTVRQALERMRETGHTRLPVYHENIDHIMGIVHYKDLTDLLIDGKEQETVGLHVYDAMFIPQTKDIYPLLADMQTNRQQMAIVVDEYGGTDGLITVEDIIEEIVGEIIDESDQENPFVEQLEDAAWMVDGRLPVEDAIEMGWPIVDSPDYETIAGWLISALDTVPQTGDSYKVDGCQFTIASMRHRRVLKIHVEQENTKSQETSAGALSAE